MILPLPIEKEMIILRDKNFSSKEQKARRAKWETQNQPRPSQKDIDFQMGKNNDVSTRISNLKVESGTNPRFNKTEKEAIVAAKKVNSRLDRRFEGSGDKLATDPKLRQEWRQREAKGLKNAKELVKKWDEEEKLAKEREAKRIAERKAKESAKSIAKHEAKAAELRAKKALGQKIKTAGKVGLGVAATAGIGYGIKKAVDKKQE